MAGTFQMGGVSMTERAVINKYTLIPIGAVIASITLTAGIMWSIMSERERIIVLETKVAAMESSTNANTTKLDRIHDDLLVIKTRLGVGEDSMLGPRTDAQ